MASTPPNEFPNVVCWHPETRGEVMNTIALDVRPSIFKATHFPSIIQQEGAVHGAFVTVTEGEFLDDFLDPRHPHVFDIAVGDSGTGKSHLINWMYQEIVRRQAGNDERYWPVLVPRSSSNLADVVRRILHGFSGEVANKLREELGQHQGFSLDQVRQRVIDEIIYVLVDRLAVDVDLIPGRSLGREEKDLLELLPAVLRRQEFRRALVANERGIVSRLARHVLGHREGSDEDDELRWRPTDLVFSYHATRGASDDALEAADMLSTDVKLRELAADVINRLQPAAVRQLLRFRSGDMKAALTEIRQELLAKGKELVLLIEDLSITEGLDAELVEALQIRTRDSGTELCRLRSIVGVTHDDFARLRENIAHGRTHRVIHFNVGLDAVGPSVLADFASRYLGAARLTLAELDAWGSLDDQPPPSRCDECPNRGSCHETFGAIEGRGLYPLSRIALPRLYDHVASARRSTSTDHAFNPRMLVSRVLNEFLKESEQSILHNTFPRAIVTTTFKLNHVRPEVQLEIRKVGRQADRLQRAVDLYADDPSAARPILEPGISRAFALPPLDLGQRVTPATAPPDVTTTVVPPPVDGGDEFDRWLREERPADQALNAWRGLVYDAVCAAIDWDATQLGALKSKLKRAQITFEGQSTKPAPGDVALLIRRTPENAIALKTLAGRWSDVLPSERERAIRQARHQIIAWRDGVERQLIRFRDESGEPVLLAVELLIVGALLRGKHTTRITDENLLAEALRDWPKEASADRTPEWTVVSKSYERYADEVRDLVKGAVSCTKGASIGSMIDPSALLPALRQAITAGRPRRVPPEAASWVQFAPVARLAGEVEAALELAIAKEHEACTGWVSRMTGLVGDMDFASVAERLKAAILAATNAGASGPSLRGTRLFDRLQALRDRPIASQRRDAIRAAEADMPRAGCLAALGKLDWTVMKEADGVLADARQVLEELRVSVEQRLQQFGEDSDPVQMEAECLALLAATCDHLATIAHETPGPAAATGAQGEVAES